MRKIIALLATAASLTLSGCGYNTMQAQDEGVKGKWSEVINQYQRRSDLIDNLVKTAQGEAAYEKGVFTEVAAARASVGSIKATPELVNDPVAFQKFTDAQNQLQGSIQRLLVTVEQYPTLKANQAFQNVQVELIGTENRIAVARNNYIKSVTEYNTTLRTFPNNLTAKVMGYATKANYTVGNEAEISSAPKVEFNQPK